jgi:hypothetical protein
MNDPRSTFPKDVVNNNSSPVTKQNLFNASLGILGEVFSPIRLLAVSPWTNISDLLMLVKGLWLSKPFS